MVKMRFALDYNPFFLLLICENFLNCVFFKKITSFSDFLFLCVTTELRSSHTFTISLSITNKVELRSSHGSIISLFIIK